MITDSEAYYYQQIVINLHVFRSTFTAEKEIHGSWQMFYAHLVHRGILTLSHPVPTTNTEPAPTGPQTTPPLSKDQQSYFDQLTRDIVNNNNNVHFVVGAAGTGKSYLLKKLESYFEDDFNVVKLAPTGITAHNIGGQTIHRFFYMANERSVINPPILSNTSKVFVIPSSWLMSFQ